MKTILFPTDFSDNASHAAQYAGMLAKLFNAKIVLLNIYSIPTVSEYQLPSEIEDFIIRNRKEAEKALQDFAVKFIEKTGLAPERVIQRVEYGLATDKIVNIANAIKSDMIVMGTKGAGTLLDRWLGTHAQEVMKLAECPVWVIPADASFNYPKNILYAADFQGDEVETVQQVFAFTKPLGTKLKVVHIHDYFEMNLGHSIQEMAHLLEDKFKSEELKVISLSRAEIIEGLETYINNQSPDVLLLAVHEKPFLDRLFNDSVTKHFVQAGKLPLLFFQK
jgi:nucleotide-binding universal stress UspA family protein